MNFDTKASKYTLGLQVNWSGYDLDFWSLTMKTFPAMPAHSRVAGFSTMLPLSRKISHHAQ